MLFLYTFQLLLLFLVKDFLFWKFKLQVILPQSKFQIHFDNWFLLNFSLSLLYIFILLLMFTIVIMYLFIIREWDPLVSFLSEDPSVVGPVGHDIIQGRGQRYGEEKEGVVYLLTVWGYLSFSSSRTLSSFHMEGRS